MAVNRLGPLFSVQPAPFVGPAAINAILLNAAATAPNEGLWVPAGFIKAATLNLSGSMDTLGVDLYASNALDAPANAYTVTVGGTITDGDGASITVTNPNLPGGAKTKSVAIVTADTTTTIAAKLAAAINADTDLAAAGIVATSAVAVVTINYPSQSPSAAAAGTYPQESNPTAISTAVTGGSPSETLTAAVTTTGTKIGSTLAAFGWTIITNLPVGWIKARLTTLTGTGANATAALQGVTQ